MLRHKLFGRQLMTRRTFLLSIGKIGLLFSLIGRLFYMQFIKKDEYKTLSDQNRIKTLLLPPMRGQIFDRHNLLIAQERNCFNLILDKANRIYKTELEFVYQLLSILPKQQTMIAKRIREGNVTTPVIIIDYLSWQQVALLEEQKHNLQAIMVDVGLQRHYHYPYAMSHLIGYLGQNRQKAPGIRQNIKIGKTGLERQYQPQLEGEFGFRRIEVNAKGHYVRQLACSNSIAGQDLKLNIDLELQQKTMDYLSPKGASAIVMDCQTGAILIAASSPGYDNNQFDNLTHSLWQELLHDPYNPLFNKITCGLYPPGSIFKVVTVLAALESGMNWQQKITCHGKEIIGGKKFRCARLRGHGAINMIEAVKFSCNSYMYAIARQLGPEKIIAMAEKLGFGQLTGIDLPNEKAGLLPNPAWKKQQVKRRWGLGDSLNLAIGQGFTLVTPLQLLRMMAAIASGGKLFTPQIVQGPASYVDLNLNQQHVAIVQKALYEVMNQMGGTGYASRLQYENIYMSGKTGTAQVRAKKHDLDNLSGENIAWQNRNHAIFAGYAPHNQPKYAILYYFDHGGGGGRAATPIAKKIMQDVLGKYS